MNTKKEKFSTCGFFNILPCSSTKNPNPGENSINYDSKHVQHNIRCIFCLKKSNLSDEFFMHHNGEPSLTILANADTIVDNTGITNCAICKSNIVSIKKNDKKNMRWIPENLKHVIIIQRRTLVHYCNYLLVEQQNLTLTHIRCLVIQAMKILLQCVCLCQIQLLLQTSCVVSADHLRLDSA